MSAGIRSTHREVIGDRLLPDLTLDAFSRGVNPVAKDQMAALLDGGAQDLLTHLGDQPLTHRLAAPPRAQELEVPEVQ